MIIRWMQNSGTCLRLDPSLALLWQLAGGGELTISVSELKAEQLRCEADCLHDHHGATFVSLDSLDNKARWEPAAATSGGLSLRSRWTVEFPPHGRP